MLLLFLKRPIQFVITPKHFVNQIMRPAGPKDSEFKTQLDRQVLTEISSIATFEVALEFSLTLTNLVELLFWAQVCF